jgi:uncharacterized protein
MSVRQRAATAASSQAGRTFEQESGSRIRHLHHWPLQAREQHGSRSIIEARQWADIVAVIDRAMIMRMTGQALYIIPIVMAVAVMMIMIATENGMPFHLRLCHHGRVMRARMQRMQDRQREQHEPKHGPFSDRKGSRSHHEHRHYREKVNHCLTDELGQYLWPVNIPSRGIAFHTDIIMSAHESHPEIVKRLKRAEGHLRSIITMIEEERPCLDIAQQLQAVEKAVSEAKRALIRDHLDHCIDHVTGPLTREQRVVIDDFKSITKYL